MVKPKALPISTHHLFGVFIAITCGHAWTLSIRPGFVCLNPRRSQIPPKQQGWRLDLVGVKSTAKTEAPTPTEKAVNDDVQDGKMNPKAKGKTKMNVEISTVGELDECFDDPHAFFREKVEDAKEIPATGDEILRSICVKGDTQIIGSAAHPDVVHPVLRVLHERKRTQSKPTSGQRDDGFRVALAIEGGGMRGCVSAGMVAAIDFLGLRESVDVVYGSSAGTVIGSYFLTGQLPWFGPEIYYDSLTTSGRQFIDVRRLLRKLGLGLIDPRLWRDVLTRRENGKPVLNLDFLMKRTVMEKKPLDWQRFADLQTVQPLKVVVSGLKSEQSMVLDMEKGHFTTLDEYTRCMHASCLLPGIAGSLINICMNSTFLNTNSTSTSTSNSIYTKFVQRNDFNDENYEPLADALIYEPLPYRSAVAEGATHVLVLRTRPDGIDVTGKSSVFERLIMKRFFLRKNRFPRIYQRMRQQRHKKLYGEDVLVLNRAAHDVDRDPADVSSERPHLMPVALPPGSEEVGRLELRREKIFGGVRRGFARAYDALVEDPAQRGRGVEVAKQFFPDEILDYDPLTIDSQQESAFAIYLKQQQQI